MINDYGWENWFAWYPVWTEKGELIWMETVERKEVLDFDRDYIYRRIDNQPKNTNFAINL